jgi:uncharacterized damage-inducible protein DinB
MESLKQALHQQYDAAITMLENAVKACPEWLWDNNDKGPAFWQVLYHTTYYLDLYFSEFDETLSTSPKHDGTAHRLETVPERTRSKVELLELLSGARLKCLSVLDALNQTYLERSTPFEWQSFNRANLVLDNLRHVQHHVGQLALLLRREANLDLEWIE